MATKLSIHILPKKTSTSRKIINQNVKITNLLNICKSIHFFFISCVFLVFAERYYAAMADLSFKTIFKTIGRYCCG